MKAVARVVAADNEMGIRDLGPQLLMIPEILSGLKLVNDKQQLSIVISKDGKEKTYILKPEGAFQNMISPPSDWVDAANKQSVPLYLEHQADMYWFEYQKENRLVYVKQNAVQNKPDENLSDFYKRIFAFIEANPVDKLGRYRRGRRILTELRRFE